MSKSTRGFGVGRRSGTVTVIEQRVHRSARENARFAYIITVIVVGLAAMTVASDHMHPILAGLLGGLLGEALYGRWHWGVLLVLGWTLVGLLVGLSVGVFDLLARLAQGGDPYGAVRKVGNGLLGGALGGVVGGTLSLLLRGAWAGLFEGKPSDLLWSPSATGFVALGACIGLMVGLAQVILKEAWLKVERGFRAGRELILSKPVVTIGRAEACDVGLFGDPGVDKLHARILRRGNGYLVEDADSSGGTYLNGERVDGPARLRSGDAIRVGRCVLRFGERRASVR